MRTVHFDVVGPADAKTTWLFLHGILGRGMNLRGIARALAADSSVRAILVDLPHHGQSTGVAFDHVHTVKDVARALAESISENIDVVVGHSFGGRVALWLEDSLRPHTTFVLDSPPGRRAERQASATTELAMGFLRRAAGQGFASRDAFLQNGRQSGLSESVAVWLAMNLIQLEGAYTLGIDVARIDALLQSLFDDDAWSCVESAHGRMHFLVASRESAFNDLEKERLASAQAAFPERVFVHDVDAGHWLHADNPAAVLRVLHQHGLIAERERKVR